MYQCGDADLGPQAMAVEDIDADVVLVGDVFYNTAIAGTPFRSWSEPVRAGPGYVSEIRAGPGSRATGCTLWQRTGPDPPPRTDAELRWAHVLELA